MTYARDAPESFRTRCCQPYSPSKVIPLSDLVNGTGSPIDLIDVSCSPGLGEVQIFSLSSLEKPIQRAVIFGRLPIRRGFVPPPELQGILSDQPQNQAHWRENQEKENHKQQAPEEPAKYQPQLHGKPVITPKPARLP